MIGLNCFQAEEKTKLKLHRLDPKIAKEQLSRLKKFKAQRKSKVVEMALKTVQTEATYVNQGKPAKLCEGILTAVESRCTLGEISDVMRAVAGTFE